ncbi:uncharacterized protein LOC117812108 isoform X3 [Notolabrus celidotus]|uniref:uncharacterized protein LOC117812108 isoform X3 n=1 Tax=Notolabrus celidotus TaxID=1203425 RepID=UPI0014905D18|nr:uncharacterized protein LOC117812108 isoform X3 [Notolabrus celidotus]
MMSKRKSRIKPVEDATSYILSSRDKPWFAERFINNIKGRGVFATEPIEQGSFVLEYRGEFISVEECRSRHYSETQSTFLYEFHWQKRQWCIDASKEDGSLGRLVNDNHKSPNCIMKKVIVNNKPHLCLFAVKNIEIGSELDYNYGDSKWPWRKKVTYKQAPAAEEEEMAVLPVNLSFRGDGDDASPKEFTVRGSSLVDYSDSDESNENCLNDQPLGPHCDEVVPKLRRTKSILMKTVPDFSDDLYDSSDDGTEGPSTQSKSEMASQRMETLQDFCQPLCDSNESIVEETDDADSIKDHSDVQSDIEVVPKLRRTKSIQMKKVPDFSDALYDSSDDSTEGPSTQSKSEMASQRPRRGCYRPIQKILVGSDASSVDSGEEYVPGRMEESTDSDCSLEIPMENKNMNKVSTSPKRCKPSSKDRFKSSSQSTFKSSSQKNFESSSQSQFESSSRSQFESSSRSQFESSSRSQVESSSQNQFESSSRSQVESSSQNQFESSSQNQFESSSQNQFESSSRSQFESSSLSQFESSSQSNFISSQSSSFETSNGPAESNCMNEEKVGQTCTDEDALENHENNSSVYVNPVLKKEDGSRLYNKKHHCFYCKKVVQKMSRHLLRMHNDKIEVAKAFSLPKNSKERRLHLDFIRNKGNFEHNTEVLESQKGKLIPFKQPKKKTEGQEFLHCVYCYGLFTKRVMWRHFQVCKFKPQDKTSKAGKTRVQALCAFAEPVPPGFSDAYWKFLNDMNQDKIAIAVKQDSCILEYGYRLFKKNERVISQHQYIRQKLRELGRLLLAAKKVAPVKTVKELIKPEKYAHVVTAARHLAGFSDETGKYKCPSLARKVGHSMHALAMFMKSEGLKARDKETVQDAEEFAQLYQESWKFDIASQALIQLDQSKWNSPQLLPFTQDVQSLHVQLSEKQQQHLDALKEEASPSNWKDLAKVTLAQVILFNRRREGEVSKMPLSVYLLRDQSETHDDVNLALTELEQKLCKHFVRITIVGKRGRKVPVLLTPLMRESLDILVLKREECGVLTENSFLFALPHSVHHLRGSDCIRQLVHECSDIKNPTALTSTKLRKHIATLSTVLNLKNTELDQLADFLGHNIDVHRKHYRLPEGTLQLAKISKVLLALEQGRLGKYKGKSLDEIHIDPNETVEIEACSQEDMEDASMAEAQGSENETSTTSLQESTFAPNQRRKFAKKRVASITEAQESEDEDSMMSLPASTSAASAQNQRSSAKTREARMAEAQESEDEASTASLQKSIPTASAQNHRRKFAKKRSKQTAVKRNWTPEECAAVRRHLKKFIVMAQVPGKEDCQRCITAEPQALKSRDWRAVKYFIKNRISSLRRKIE